MVNGQRGCSVRAGRVRPSGRRCQLGHHRCRRLWILQRLQRERHDPAGAVRCATVLVTTTRFQHVVDTLAANGGMPSIRTLVLEHPIGGTDRVALDHRAAGAVDRVLHLFTGPPASGDPPTVARETTGVDIESLQALVAADGGDLQIDSVDDPEGTVRLSLILPDASCRACVLPGDQLADIAFHRLVGSRPGLRSVVVLDPRDGYLHSGRRP